MEQIDFLAVGDIATNSYIRLRDASVNCDLRHEHCQICLDFGEKVPYEFVERIASCGNGPNAAVAASRLGLKVAVVTDIGEDEGGAACLRTFAAERVATDFVKKHPGRPTNHHYVLWYEDERTILVKHEGYEYNFPDCPAPKCLYFSSVGENTESYHAQIAAYLEKNPETKLAFQPGTFQIKSGYEKMEYFYKRADIFAVNATEARKILKIGLEEASVGELLLRLHNLGPKSVIITDGKKGVFLFDGKDSWHMPIFPDPKPPYERTGAGDALSSTYAAGITLGESPLEALKWGLINARSVVQNIGPQKGLLTREEISNQAAKAPAEFRPMKI